MPMSIDRDAPQPAPAEGSDPPAPGGSRRRRFMLAAGTAILGLTVIAATAIWTDALGAGERWQHVLDRVDRALAGPVPDRSNAPTVVITSAPSPMVTPRPTPGPSLGVSGSPPVAPTPEPTPSPTPVRAPVDVVLPFDPVAVFAHEIRDTWCAPAGLQMVLAIDGLADTSDATQRSIADRVHEFESYADSHNGGWGPSAMAAALAAYGVPGYEVRAYDTRADALRGAAVALEATGSPVILLAWRGAHTWVMSGFRADADPAMFGDATVSGTYILDPWYPTVSTIWGASDPPGTFQDAAEMVRNFLPWKRPEGHYPDRDGRFIIVAPTVTDRPAGSAGP